MDDSVGVVKAVPAAWPRGSRKAVVSWRSSGPGRVENGGGVGRLSRSFWRGGDLWRILVGHGVAVCGGRTGCGWTTRQMGVWGGRIGALLGWRWVRRRPCLSAIDKGNLWMSTKNQFAPTPTRITRRISVTEAQLGVRLSERGFRGLGWQARRLVGVRWALLLAARTWRGPFWNRCVRWGAGPRSPSCTGSF